MPNSELNVQECDARDDDSSKAAGYISTSTIIEFLCIVGITNNQKLITRNQQPFLRTHFPPFARVQGDNNL